MYTLYIANKNYSSWSLRPWLLLEQLAIPFEEILKPFIEGENWQRFRQFSPSGLVPCLVDGDITVWDSLAMIEYIAEQHAGVWPQDMAARAWGRSACAEMHGGFSALRNQCAMNCSLRLKLHQQSDGLVADITRINELWADGINRFGGPFLAGEKFTAVDAYFAPVVFRIVGYGIKVNSQAQQYVATMQALASMQNWQQQALAESWREQAHDREVLVAATLIEDLRK